MFVGHFGVALAAKGVAPKTPLPVLFLATEFLDVLWGLFLMAGFEHASIEAGYTPVSPLNLYDFPYSHSLAAAVVWAVVFGSVYAAVQKDSWGGWVVGTLVGSHWLLDFVAHRPDLPLYPGGTERYGYYLWHSVEQTIVVEGVIFFLGIVLYLGATRAKDLTGTLTFWPLMLLLTGLWLGSIYGERPPTITVLAVTTLAAFFVIFVWAWWIEQHRIAHS
jgi:hypothetical protein